MKKSTISASLISLFIILIILMPIKAKFNKLNQHQEETVTEISLAQPKKLKNNTVDCNDYYYECLNDKNKEIYNKIYTSIINREKELVLDNTTNEIVSLVYDCVLYDHPEIFYMSNKYSYYGNIHILFSYSMTEDEIEQASLKIKNYENEVLKQINDNMDAYEKEKIIYDYIATHTEYVLDSEYNQDIYSVVNNKSVCLGYSKMFQYLCEKVNIPCTIIVGKNKDNIRHSWNCVCINKEWYMVDCTNAMGQVADAKDEISYYFFNITTKQMLRNYSIDNNLQIPECTSIEAEYFNKNGLYFDNFDTERYKELINKNSGNELIIRCNSNETLLSFYSWLYEEKGMFEVLDDSTVAEIIKNDETLTLQLNWTNNSLGGKGNEGTENYK